MKCSYFEYRELTDKLFYGVALTDQHLNDATEQIRRYLIDGGAGNIIKKLNIGIQVTTKEAALLPAEVIRRRFIWLSGERKGEELSIDEIRGVGMFLKHGALYGKYVTEEDTVMYRIKQSEWDKVSSDFKGEWQDYHHDHPEWKGKKVIMSSLLSDNVNELGRLLIEDVDFTIENDFTFLHR